MRHKSLTARRRHQGENRVFLVCQVAGEVDSRVELFQHATGEYGNVEMRRLGNIACAGHAARLDGFEFAASVLRGTDASETEKAGVDGLGLLLSSG